MVWTTRELLILGTLVLCVPAQYWLVSQWPVGTPPKQIVLHIGKQIEKLDWIWFECLDWWNRWYLQFVSTIRKYLATSKREYLSGECPAKEVIAYRTRSGYFGLAPEIRSNRPGYISYRVGQVVEILEHEGGATGAIIAWDLYCRAPDSWLESRYGNDLELRKEPHYRVLLATPFLQETYIAQRYLKVLRATEIDNPKITEYFTFFDGAQYIPRETLRYLYPLD